MAKTDGKFDQEDVSSEEETIDPPKRRGTLQLFQKNTEHDFSELDVTDPGRAIRQATLYKSKETLEALLKEYPDAINEQDNNEKRHHTALHLAVLYYDDPAFPRAAENLATLLAHKADYSIKDADGCSPVDYVTGYGRGMLLQSFVNVLGKRYGETDPYKLYVKLEDLKNPDPEAWKLISTYQAQSKIFSP